MSWLSKTVSRVTAPIIKAIDNNPELAGIAGVVLAPALLASGSIAGATAVSGGSAAVTGASTGALGVTDAVKEVAGAGLLAGVAQDDEARTAYLKATGIAAALVGVPPVVQRVIGTTAAINQRIIAQKELSDLRSRLFGSSPVGAGNKAVEPAVIPLAAVGVGLAFI